jgi:1-acyl-sn-glycerol-3-phosphate acyltransferase
MPPCRQPSRRRLAIPALDRILDCGATLACWAWFTFGFILFFSWRYLAYALFVKNPEIQFQRLNSLFYRIFFRVVRITAPRQKIEIDEKIASIKSSVIVCNHLSYLDPLLLIALFPRHRTIVKTRFFSTPIFGWMITKSGYLPATGEGRFSRLMVTQMETMEQYLKDGGNLFIFPEGTRSRNGKIGEFNRGAFKIARMCGAPLYVLQLRNTDTLFTPGRFLFNTRVKNTISIEIIKHLDPDYNNNPPSSAELLQQVRREYVYEQERLRER